VKSERMYVKIKMEVGEDRDMDIIVCGKE